MSTYLLGGQKKRWWFRKDRYQLVYSFKIIIGHFLGSQALYWVLELSVAEMHSPYPGRIYSLEMKIG